MNFSASSPAYSGPAVVAEPEADLGIRGSSPNTVGLRRDIRRVATVDDPSVLITGESGSGKELAARAVHMLSNRRTKPFVPVRCSALLPQLVQSELFGYTSGVFSEASEGRIGWIAMADGGTLFLDDISDLTLESQASLLRFLEQGTIQPLGGHCHQTVDVRVIAATSVDLRQSVAAGGFRTDLLYRLDVLRIAVPTLQDREGDVVDLARAFLEREAPGKHFSRDAVHAMLRHNWPGNIRELHNRIRRALLVEGPTVGAFELGLSSASQDNGNVLSLDDARTHAERETVLQALQRTGNNLSQTAELLGISRMTLYRLIKRCGIDCRKRK